MLGNRSNKKLVYRKTSHYLSIISLFPNNVQCFFVDKPRAQDDGKKNPDEQKPGRSAEFFVQKPAREGEDNDWHRDRIAKVPGKGEGRKRLIGFFHGII
jgi:hypothetical protein